MTSRSVVALTVCFTVAPWLARAEEKRAPAPARVLMEEVEIRGEVERPDVFYIIPRRQVQLDLGSLSKDYRSDIMKPLLPGAFEKWVHSGGAGGRP
jgi:hypothetical protein